MVDDLRYAARLLVKNPRINGLIITILGLGIGLNIAVFNYLDATALRPFQYVDQERIVQLVRGRIQRFSGPFTYHAYQELRDNNSIFESVGAFRDRAVTISIGETTESKFGTEVSAGLFELLGAQPMLGRPFMTSELGHGRSQVAIISHQFWKARFGADPGILGGVIRVDGLDREIVGVMPVGFKFYMTSSIWLPLPVDGTSNENESYRLNVLGRLRKEITLEQAHASMATLRESIEASLGGAASGGQGNQVLVLVSPSGAWRAPAGVVAIGVLFQLAAVFVLLIVGWNVAGLLFARGVSRQREIAVRGAIGAPPGRVMRQLLAENLLLAFGGASLGLIVAIWGHDLLLVAFPDSPLRIAVDFRLDLQKLAFAILLSIITVLAVGMFPALRLSKLDLSESLKEGGASATLTRRARRRQGWLAASQVAVSLVLLIGASLTARTTFALRGVERGFDAENVYHVFLSFDSQSSKETQAAVSVRIIEALETHPGIEAVGWENAPTDDIIGTFRDRLRGHIETRDGPSNLAARVRVRAVNASYFRALGLSLVHGSFFGIEDQSSSPTPVILSKRAVALLWPGDMPLGRRIRFPGSGEWLTVVGIVDDIVRLSQRSYDNSEFGVRAEPWPDLYLPVSPSGGPPDPLLYVRPNVARAGFSQIVHDVIGDMSPGVHVAAIRSVEEAEYQPNQNVYHEVAKTLGALGIIALAISALGTYSTVSYMWIERSRELAVRTALGASATALFWLVVRNSLMIGVRGVFIGTLISLALYRLTSGLLFGVSPWDPFSYTGVAFLFLCMAILASLSPARHAVNTDPLENLRQE